jgi:Replication protein
MPGRPQARCQPSAEITSLETSASSVTSHLKDCLLTWGLTTLAEKVSRCCTAFHVLACAKGHVYHAIPAERCQHRLCPNCARQRQQRAITRLWPAIKALRQRHPEDRWGFITLTATAGDEPLRAIVRRLQRWFARFRRTTAWRTAIRGAVAGVEVTYRPGRGWHVHVHLLASRQAWWDQADLAAAWQRTTDGQGKIAHIQDRDADVRASMCRTLTYPFKPMNLTAWGPAQVAEFTALGRTKLAECYGALRGLVVETTEDTDEAGDAPRPEPKGPALRAGAPCPACGTPLTPHWYTPEEVRWGRRLSAHRPQAPPGRPRAA